MQPGDWNDTRGLAFACGLRPTDPRRHQLLLLFNPDPVATRFELGRERWQLLLDSSAADTAAVAASESAEIQHALLAPAHSLLLLRSLTPTGISA
jgi:hypothetical protein